MKSNYDMLLIWPNLLLNKTEYSSSSACIYSDGHCSLKITVAVDCKGMKSACLVILWIEIELKKN